MLVHPAQQSGIVAAGPAPRKSLRSCPSLEKEPRSIDLQSVFADDEPTPSEADEIAGKTGEWCERNSVALLEACCNRDVLQGACVPAVLKRDLTDYFSGYRGNTNTGFVRVEVLLVCWCNLALSSGTRGSPTGSLAGAITPVSIRLFSSIRVRDPKIFAKLCVISWVLFPCGCVNVGVRGHWNNFFSFFSKTGRFFSPGLQPP